MGSENNVVYLSDYIRDQEYLKPESTETESGFKRVIQNHKSHVQQNKNTFLKMLEQLDKDFETCYDDDRQDRIFEHLVSVVRK